MDKNNHQKPILAVLRDMSIGDIEAYPLSKISSVRTSCSTFGLQWGKTFSTRVNRQQGLIFITRTN